MKEMENSVHFYRGGEGGRRSGEAGGRALLRRADRSSSVAAVIETAAARNQNARWNRTVCRYWSRFLVRTGTKAPRHATWPALELWSRFLPRTGTNAPNRTGTNAPRGPGSSNRDQCQALVPVFA